MLLRGDQVVGVLDGVIDVDLDPCSSFQSTRRQITRFR